MTIVHLTASTFFGGPERQMLGLARAVAPDWRTRFAAFAEGGRCTSFLTEVRRHGFEGTALTHDTPRLGAATEELADLLRHWNATSLFCHGYKANLVGRRAARRAGVPAIAVSRGWTGESWKVRLYEWLDRAHLRWMDHVVCVSEGQAVKVRRAGVAEARLTVIRNAIQAERFDEPDPAYASRLGRLLTRPCRPMVAAAGRLSPEKGFDLFVDAAARLRPQYPEAGFVLFGDGPLRESLARQASAAGLGSSFALAGFRSDFDRFLPFVDVLVLPSHTEGLPNVVLEAHAAGVPVVATAVGGTPEVVSDGYSGYLVPPGDAATLAARIGDLLASESLRRAMGERGRRRVQRDFTFEGQARDYRRLLACLGVTVPATADAIPEFADGLTDEKDSPCMSQSSTRSCPTPQRQASASAC